MVVRSRLGVVAIIALAVAGCTASKDDPLASKKPIDVVEITKNTSEFQREILADGSVTFAEYERATLAAISCIEDGGIPGVRVEGPKPRNGDERFLEWSVGWSGQAEEKEFAQTQAQISALKERCQREFQLDVSRVWEYQNLLKPEQREQLKPKVVDCLVAAGLKIERDASYEDILRAVSENSDDTAVRDCHRQFQEFFVVGVK